MEISLSTKFIAVALFVGMSSTHVDARRLYKWVDGEQVTNYSEFQPRERPSNKRLEVLESRGEHVDPAMAVTKEMKPIEIPVENEVLKPTDPALVNKNLRTTKTVFRRGDLFELEGIYVNPNLKKNPVEVAENEPVINSLNDKKEQQQEVAPPRAEKGQVSEKSEPIHAVVAEKVPPVTEKASKTPTVVEEKKTAVVPPKKRIKPTINPWTGAQSYTPSNLISTPPSKNPN